MHQQQRHYYEFGPFRLETGERVLLREGRPVPLTPKTFETLLALVEDSGRILDKEDLLRKVWPDTFVEEVSLAKKVSILRKVLGEDVDHHYIETIPRRGYRFVAEVQESWLAAQEVKGVGQGLNPPSLGTRNGESNSIAGSSSPQPRSRRRIWFLSLLSFGLLASSGLLYWSFRWGPGADRRISPALNAIPLTSYQGRENQVAFSPDGNQIAFVWNGPQGDNSDIYVKLVDAETPLRLTADPADDINPVWSPDGRSLAFIRHSAEKSEMFLIPALGGAERKLASMAPYQVPSDGSSSYFSPDGKHLAVPDRLLPSEPLGIFMISVDTGARRRLTSPPPGILGDYCPAFSPDGRSLAFTRSARWSTDDVYVVAVSGGEPARVTFDNMTIHGIAWTSDSREIVFASRRGGSTRHLWRVAVGGDTPRRVDTIGNDVLSPALAAKGGRLAYTQALDDLNIWRIELDGSGKVTTQSELIASTFGDHGPDYSPDGSRIVFASGRSGNNAIWISESDGTKPRLVHSCGPYVTGTPRWSPDGRSIVFDSRSCAPSAAGNPDVYLINADGGPATRLTEDASEDVAPSWSRDGKWIYFGSNRSGNMQIWKMPPSGGQPVQVTKNGGFEGFESTDGTHLYFTKGRAIAGIWRIPVGGGEEEFVTGHHQAGLWRYWRVVEQGIYFATASSAGPLLEFYNFKNRTINQVARLPRAAERYLPGLAVSPDGRSLLYCRMDQSGSDILMLENFR
jgi:Tol biopolymer transport system component/DNA-binding winged helix-turn-helix (wHTH) protein